MASATIAASAEPSPTTESHWFPSRRQLFLTLVAYFSWHLICRTLISSSVDLDESEQFVLTQRLLWGYGSQPPLYTWIQSAFFAIFGANIFALSLLKNLLLFCIATLTYVNGRRITRSHAGGLVATLLLAFVPRVVWESQRDLTHSVLAAALSLATLYAFLRLVERPRAVTYMLFGVGIGLGTLSKYNYVFFPIGLLTAALTVKEFRCVILNPRMLLALAVAIFIVLPNGLWMLHHSAQALYRVSKFQIHEDVSWLRAVATGFQDMGGAVVAFLAPMTLVLIVVFWKARHTAGLPTACDPLIKLTRRILPGVLAAVAVLILAFRVTDVKERWLEPLLIIAPVVAAAWLRPWLDPRRLNWLTGLAVFVGIIVAAAVPGRFFLAERLHREETLTRPYGTLTHALEKSLAPQTTIVAATPLLAGNLRLHLPARPVTTPELVGLFPFDPENVVLVWEANRRPEMPPKLSDFAARQGLSELTNQSPEYLSAPYYYHKAKRGRLGSVKRERIPNAPATTTNSTPP